MIHLFRLMKLFIFCTFSLISVTLYGQDIEVESDSFRLNAVKVFLDCRSCDMNYTREQIPYVNYVRDIKEAEVFILVTTQNAGSGGNQYTYRFQGQGNYQGMNDTLLYTSTPDETSSVIREKRTNLLKMGLMRYVARTPVASEIIISHNTDLEAEEVVDRWNFWVFEFSISPRFDVEESFSRINVSNSVNISRVTPEMKLEIELDQSTNRQKYTDDYGLTTTYVRDQKSIENLIVKSLGNHVSAGLRLDLLSATNPNYDLNLRIMPAIEYDFFPYSESTHRQLRVLYSVGYQNSNYTDTTIYNKLSESLFEQELQIAYQVQETWGSVNISLGASNYFHDWTKNQIELDGFLRLRILKGLSLSINGGVGYINNQLNLRKGNLTEAERLLRLKQQATNFRIDGGISLSYTFGAIYNNVVNPRFGNGSGRGMGGF
ncbi:MAG: hypothetical protein JXN62_12230 [Bacteroidales bacterium]|nr:hypothetical protein [Bacteroidales bacterium]